MKHQHKFFLFSLMIILAIIFGNYFYKQGYLSKEFITGLVNDQVVFAPLIFILIYIIAVLLMMPTTPLLLLGGYLFGLYLGTTYSMIGILISSMISYTFASTLGHSTFKFVIEKSKTINNVYQKFHRNGLLTTLYLRIIPFMPFAWLNIALGMSKIRRRDYLIGTLIASIPGTFLLNALGASAFKMDISTIFVFITLLGVIFLSPIIVYLAKYLFGMFLSYRKTNKRFI